MNYNIMDNFAFNNNKYYIKLHNSYNGVKILCFYNIFLEEIM